MDVFKLIFLGKETGEWRIFRFPLQILTIRNIKTLFIRCEKIYGAKKLQMADITYHVAPTRK